MNKKTPLIVSLKIQKRVIGALLMREIITRYGRHNIGFFWLFVEPMLFTLGVTALWSATKNAHGSNIPIIAFAVTGYSAVLLWRNMPGRCAGAIGPNLALMYHRNVKIFDIFLSRILLEFFGATTSFLTLTIIFILVGWMKPPEDVGKILIGWFMLTWFGSAFALLIGALSERSELIEKLWHPMSYLLFPLSGAAFMVEWLPVKAQEIVLYLPMVHGVEILREGYFGSIIKAHYDIPYMVIICMCLSILALITVKKVALKVIPE